MTRRQGFHSSAVLALVLALAVMGVATQVGAAPLAPASTVPLPIGYQGSLSGVSCQSTTDCEAAGVYVESDSPGVIYRDAAVHFNGSRWSRQPVRLPAGKNVTSLNGISCTSSTMCVGVGSYNVGNGPMQNEIVLWNGTSWAQVSAPAPSGAASSELTSVACRRATECEAVGSYQTSLSEPARPEFLSWNGSDWTAQAGGTAKRFDNGFDYYLQAVSCASTFRCFAVGKAVSAHVSDNLVEAWNGTSWKVVDTPQPSGRSLAQWLTGVACPSSTRCFAVGSRLVSATRNIDEIMEWSGSTWVVMKVPEPSSLMQMALDSVSCVTGRECVAVGGRLSNADAAAGGSFPQAVVWNGTKWSVVPLPGHSQGTLSGVSCLSATACWAVGSDWTTANVSYPVATRWNGTSWTKCPNPYA